MLGSRRAGGGCVSWLALWIACAALWLAWSAYRRTGGDLRALGNAGDVFDQQLSGAAAGGSRTARDAEAAGALAEARTRLLGERAAVAAHRNLDQVSREIQEIRGQLERAFAAGGKTAGKTGRERWRALDGELERLQAQLGTRLRDQGDRALATLDSVLDKLREKALPSS